MTKADMQKMQNLYNDWVELLPELEKGLDQWRKANELLEPLSKFYSTPEWQQLHENFEEELDTKGNYSILSEDALWNALSEQYKFALEYLKLSTKIIARE